MLVVNSAHFIFILFILVVQTITLKSNAADTTQQTAFYKSKNSPFPSGEENINLLVKNRTTDRAEEVKFENEYYQYGLQKISTQLIKPTFAQNLNIKTPQKKMASKSDSNKETSTDTGYFLTMNPTLLRSKATPDSSKILEIPVGTFLKPLKFTNGYFEVFFKGKKGFVDISNCISKFDFAYAIYARHPRTNLKNWFYVKTRIFDQIKIYDGTMINLSSIEGLSVNKNLGIITQSTSQLPLWSRVKRVKSNIQSSTQVATWNQSFLKGHGYVWWKKNQTAIAQKINNPLIENIDSILEKEIFSASFHSQEPKKSIVSTNTGVYITDDGENWRQIEIFKNFKGPVYFYNSNLIFVGTHRSTNQGKTFQQFVNINSMAHQIKSNLGYNPKAVRVQKISSNTPSKIVFDVIADTRKLKLQTLIYTQDWKIIK